MALGNMQSVGDVTDLITEQFAVDMGTKGTTTRWRLSSRSLANLAAFANYIQASGGQVRFVNPVSGQEQYLDIEYPGVTTATAGFLNELFFDQWELITNESTDSIFADPLIVGNNNPTGVGPVPVLNYNDKTVLSRFARNGGTIADAVTSCNGDLVITAPNTVSTLTPPTTAAGPFFGGVANPNYPGSGLAAIPVIFQMPGANSTHDAYGGTAPGQLGLEIAKGQSEFEAPTYVLRHTSYCSPQSTYNTTRANTMKIYTTAKLLSEVSVGWTYNLPNRYYTEINQIPTQWAAPNEQPYYTWGWLKRITRSPILANFIVEVSVEYELSLWSNLRYALA